MQLDQLSPSQIENLRPWIEAETGMDFSGSRITRLQEAVRKVLSRHSTAANLERSLALPKERGVFLERLTAELTVGESFFFRNEYHFQALRDHVLPEILADNADKREVRTWSAGCAGGEEPYSLAILLDQVLASKTGPNCAQHASGGCGEAGSDKMNLPHFSTAPLTTDWCVSILGTDLNPKFLERAREGRYRQWSFRQTEIHEDRTCFLREHDSFQLVPRLRDQVRFAYLNLVKDVYPSPLTGTLGLDLILFRNVAIYLKPEVTRRIIERFYHALRPGGWLLLGETELSLAPTAGFEARRFEHATFHQKARGADPLAHKPLTPMPVLADFVVPSTRPPLTNTIPAARPPVLPTVPALPDWVPLPKQRAADEPVAESAVQQIDRLLAERKFDDVERAIERIANSKQRAESRLRFAQELIACASIARARQALDSCLADEPLMVDAQLLQASFAEEAGDLEKAEKAYRRALYIDRSCPMAHFHLALVLQQKGDAAAAARSVRTMLKLIEDKDPHELAEYGEGVCFGRLKEMAQMILDV